VSVGTGSRGRKALTAFLILGLTLGFAGSAASEPLLSEQQKDTICRSLGTAFLGWMCAGELEQEVESTQPSEIIFEIYTDSLLVNDRREQNLKESESGLNQTYGMAQAKAKINTIEAINNGTAEATAINQADEIIDRYYTQQQVSVLSSQERESITLNNTLNTIETTDGLSKSEVFESKCDPNDSPEFVMNEKNITLYNGSVRQYTQVKSPSLNEYNCTVINPVISGVEKKTYYEVDVESSNGNYTALHEPSEYLNTLQLIQSRHNNAESAAQTMVRSLYDNYDKGEVSVPELTGPLEIAITGSTNYDKTGSYDYLTLSLAQAGIPTNHTAAFKVTWNDDGEPQKTAWGQMFVGKGAYNNSLEVNKTYEVGTEFVTFVHNPVVSVNGTECSENGDKFSALCSNEKAVEESLNGSFTIQKMRNVNTGESINSTTLQQTEFYTDGVQDVERQLENVRDYHNDVETCSTCGGGIIGPTGSWFADLFNDLFPDLPDLSADAVGGVAVTGSIVLLLIAVILG